MATFVQRVETWLFPRLPLIRGYYRSYSRARSDMKAAIAEVASLKAERAEMEAAFFLVNNLQDNCNALEWELKRVKAERDAALFLANVVEAERNALEPLVRDAAIKIGSEMPKDDCQRWARIDVMPPNAGEILKAEKQKALQDLETPSEDIEKEIDRLEALSLHFAHEAKNLRRQLEIKRQQSTGGL